MMNVDVNVKDALVHAQQLQDTQNDIINIAKSRSFTLLSVMQSTSLPDPRAQHTLAAADIATLDELSILPIESQVTNVHICVPS